MERPTSTGGGHERRRFERIPIKLEALIAFGERPPIACVVKDFCVAGMFIQLDPRQLRLIQNGTPATLFFALVINSDRRDLRLRLEVARVIGSGLGVAFQDPDPTTIALLQSFAAPAAVEPVPRTPEALSATQRRFAAGFDKLLPDLNELVERTASQLVVDFLRQADDALFLAARDAPSNREQSRFIDAQTQLRRRHPDIKRSVPEVLLKAVAMLGNPLREKPVHSDVALPGLALVDKDEFEEFLTISELVAELESRFRDPLHDLGRRFSALARHEIEESDLPLGPTVFCNALGEHLKGFLADRDASAVIYKALQRALEPQLERLYEEANTLLINRGVLPNLAPDKPTVKRSLHGSSLRKTHPPHRLEESRPSLGLLGATIPPQALGDTLAGLARSAGRGSRGTVQAAVPAMPPGARYAGEMPVSGVMAAPPTAAGWPAGGSGEGASLATTFGTFGFGPAIGGLPSLEQAYAAAQAQLALRRQLRPVVSPERYGGTYSVGQVAEALSALQSALPADAGPALLEADVIKQRVIDALGAQGLDPRAIGQSESDAIEVIVNLFQSLLHDSLVGDFAKSALTRLQPAVHKGALLDPDFFASTQHPLRQLLNRLAMLRTGSGPDQDLVETRVRGLVDEVNVNFERDFRVLEPALRELDGILRDQRISYDENVRGVVGACEDQQRVLRERRERGVSAVGESTAAQAVAPEWHRWLNRSRALKVGERLLMNANTQSPFPVRLVWIGDDFNPYVFVDHRGQKNATLTLQQVAMYLRRGVMKPLPDVGDGAVDRALFGVVNRFHEDVAEQATHDTLTGLFNRKSFAAEVEQQLPRAGEKDPGAVLCQISVENLRLINEQHGVEAGDVLIREVSERLRKAFDKRPVVLGRLGGSEWGLFWRRGGLQPAYKEAQALLGELAAIEAKDGDKVLRPRLAAGMTAVDPELSTAEELLAVVADACNTARGQSDKPLYIAGSDNKHRKQLEQMVAYVGKAVDRARLVLMQHEVRALAREETPAAYLVTSAEDRNGKIVPPGLFAQAAAMSQHGHAVDLWTLRRALAWMTAHEAEVERYSAFIVPLSRAAIDDERMADTIVQELMQTAVPPARICFEIQERDAVAKLAEAAELINTLREFGCRFILSEFGSGQSNYEYLKGLAVDFVAIQSGILNDARQDPKDFAMAKSLNELVHFMAKLTIAPVHAEPPTLNVLRDIGVDFVHDTSRAVRLQFE